MKTCRLVLELGHFDENLLKKITTGTSIRAVGQLVASLGKGQQVELKAEIVEILGMSDAEKFPLQPKKHSLEFLREIAHLRFRTNTFGSVFRVRHALAFAVHQFFNERGFVYLHTPIITASDAEGAGEMFKVTTLPFDKTPRNEDGEVNFQRRFFWKGNQSYCKRTTGRRTGCHGIFRDIYFRTHIPGRKFQYDPASC